MSKNKNYFYPDIDDSELLTKLYKRREFYFNRVPKRDIMKNYDQVQKYRSMNCKVGDLDPREQQLILPNFINPNTSYMGCILMHGVGSGKTMTAIRIAEQFKEQVKKYGTKIHVLVPGPNTKQNFFKELVNTTGNTYLKNKDSLNQMSKADIEKEKRDALFSALQYYKIMSYKSFYKKVLGEKIVEKKIVDSQVKSSFRKNEKGDIEREIAIDRIINLNNTVLIVDEAHNISGNEYGEALKMIIKNSENLRVILLTATPMINLADEIVDLLNFIRPLDNQVQRDKIFTNEKNYQMNIKPGGLEYLKEMARGYISFYRGSIPYTFAKRVDKGKIPEGMLFTPVVKCEMGQFQYKTYVETTKNFDDTLDRASSAASNFVFPGLDKSKKNIYGYYSTDGLNIILSQLSTDGDLLRKMINKNLFNNKLSKDEENNFILESEKKNITGLILKKKYLKHFSIKFYKLINRLSKLKLGNKGPSTAFIYSNLVKAGGMELFAEALLQNGYLEYNEDKSYDIKEDTLDYKTGLTFKTYKAKKLDINEFKPATFLIVTGGEDVGEDVSEVKQKIIQEVFNNVDNIDGKHIKFILGSRVMNEGVTLKNCKQVHILDSFFNIPKMEQVIGRAIRMCVHQDVINDKYRFPKVYVYRYVVSVNKKEKGKLSTDEQLYQKAEIKYLTVKKVEHMLKQTALDCPLLYHINVFPEDLKKYKGCVYPTIENVKAGKLICPALCDFQECDLKCDDKGIDEIWDSKNKTYKNLNNGVDNIIRGNNNAELVIIKNRIKDLYRFKFVYLYNELLKELKKSFLEHQAELFDTNLLDLALEDLMPKTDNDFNNFKDIIYDKYNREGYLIQRGEHYIFQPFNQNENVSMYYRQNININQQNQVSINNYIKQNYTEYVDKDDENLDNVEKEKGYNFEDTLDYYMGREENKLVGIIDKNPHALSFDDVDVFKIRTAMTKDRTGKRGTGITTLKGTVCFTSGTKDELMEKLNKLYKITNKKVDDKLVATKDDVCNEMKKELLYLEKYSTGSDKKTYMMIPKDHPLYEFPYNLEDRKDYIKQEIYNYTKSKPDIEISKKKNEYEISISNSQVNKYKGLTDKLKELKFIEKGKDWIRIIN